MLHLNVSAMGMIKMKEILFFWKKSGVFGRKLHFLEAKRSFRLCSTLFPMVFDVCKMHFLLLTVRLSSMLVPMVFDIFNMDCLLKHVRLCSTRVSTVFDFCL